MSDPETPETTPTLPPTTTDHRLDLADGPQARTRYRLLNLRESRVGEPSISETAEPSE